MTALAAKAICFHCQSPVPASAKIAVSIDGTEHALCCPGCLAAVQFIRELNLDSYYQYREQCSVNAATGMSPTRVDADILSAALSVLSNGQQRMSLLIPDIRCVACVWLLEQVLKKQHGVSEVSVNYATRRLKVDFDSSVEPAVIADKITALGYTVKPDLPDATREAYTQTRRNMLMRLGVAGIGMMQVMMFALAAYLAGGNMEAEYETLMRWASLALTTPVVFFSAWPFHRAAWFALRNRSLVMDVPVSIAILSAWLLSFYNTLTLGHEVYYDTACMFTFFLLIGRYIELTSRYHFQHSQDLLDHLLPVFVYRLNNPADKTATTDEKVALATVARGDVLRVRPGETIPADGIVTQGSSGVSEAAFTGEPLPQTKQPGSRVLAGALNHDGELLIRVRSTPEKFVIRQIASLYEQASSYRPRWSQLADRTASWFIGAVLIIAAGAGLFWYNAGSADYVVIALTVLVVACPCALSLATPVAYSVATTTLRRNGVVVKNGAFLERAAETRAVVFDKTGTLTEAALTIIDTHALTPLDQTECLAIAAALEEGSEHPIAMAFSAQHDLTVTDSVIVPGCGIRGAIDGDIWRIGRPDFASGDAKGSITPPCPATSEHQRNAALWVLLSRNFLPVAWFQLQDKPRDEAASVIKTLNQSNLLTAIFTGDNSMSKAQISEKYAVTQVITNMMPDDKVNAVRALQEKMSVMMLGDGINDTAAMAAADTSLAVSPRDVFVQNSADATLLDNGLTVLPRVIKFARKSRRIIRQNVIWSISYNFTVIPFALMGLVPPWLAALGMSLSSVLVVSNAGRLRRMED